MPPIDLHHIPTNNGAESRSGWIKIQQMYENVHPSLVLVLFFERAEVDRGKGPFSIKFLPILRLFVENTVSDLT